MDKAIAKQIKRTRRHTRIRSKINGTSKCPRLAVFRSNRYVYAQLINDETSTTLASADSRNEKGISASERASAVGESIALVAKKLKIEKIVFDRGGFQYQGLVKSLADGARKAGLVF